MFEFYLMLIKLHIANLKHIYTTINRTFMALRSYNFLLTIDGDLNVDVRFVYSVNKSTLQY